jgi:hypothetical protein
MRGTKKPSLIIVLLLLFAVVHSEYPELVHLQDDVSNDFTMSACGAQPVIHNAIFDAGTPNMATVPAHATPDRALHVARFSEAAIPLHLTGQDLLLLGSIHRT